MNPAAYLAFLAAALSGALAVAAVARKRRSLASWSFFLGMLLFAVEAACHGISLRQVAPDRIEYWQELAFLTRCLLPAPWLCFSLVYSRGNYRDFLRRWGAGLIVVFLGPLILFAVFGTDLVSVIAPDPPQEEWWLRALPIARGLNGFLLLTAVMVLTNLERTLRSAIGTMRWRIKFLVLGLAIIFAVRFYARSQGLLFAGHALGLVNLETGALLVGCLLIGAAYVRSGFAEVDVYPSRAVLQTSLTLLLAGVYLFIVGVLAQLVARFGGAEAFRFHSFIVLLGVTLLALLLLSDRFRQKLQFFVSRHFQRPQHDPRTIWTRLTLSLANVVDEERLAQAASRVIADTFQTLSISTWLLDHSQQRLVCVTSTQHEQKGDSETKLEIAAAEFIAASPEELSRPVDMSKAKGPWTKTISAAALGHFGDSGICLPLVAGESRLGLILLADRVGNLPYSIEELDLLKCIGDQIAASLVNARLTREVIAAREIQAFQTMSTFFVHDLKNTASSLGLMLRNLPRHYEDQAFRDDLLRGIGNAADRINQMIRSLSGFRGELQLKPTETDLNRLINETLQQINGAIGELVSTKLQALPTVAVDPDKLQSVITNLLLNARDAVGTDGRILIETRSESSDVVVTVSDNGVGMSETFIKESLFRPFQTTKKKGLGIGMFQSRMIIEAHRGTIDVHSKAGAGTVVELRLPRTGIK
jgi:putative PEP-CTERM system histidine kinase